MLYPQNGSIAIGSRRVTPTCPVAAAVVSEAIDAPTKTTCGQSKDWYTSGATRRRRPPKRIAEIGTPSGDSHSGEMLGHCRAGAVYRALGCATGSAPFGSADLPRQSIVPAGNGSLMPSPQGRKSGGRPTVGEVEFLFSAA